MAPDDPHMQADGTARQVLDTWRNKLASGGAGGRAASLIWASLPPDFQRLLELAFQYDDARRGATIQQECGMLTAAETELEEQARAQFMSAYRLFMEAHPDQLEH